MYACLYFFLFFCYHKLVNKDLYIKHSNGSLLPGGWLKSHPRADCLYTRISSGPDVRCDLDRGISSYDIRVVIKQDQKKHNTNNVTLK